MAPLMTMIRAISSRAPVQSRSSAVNRPISAAAAMTTAAGPSIVTGRESAVGATGLGAVDLFAEDLPQWPEVFPDDVLDLVLQGLSAFVEKAGTGGGLFRRLLSSGASDIARLTGDARASEVAATAAAITAGIGTTVTATKPPSRAKPAGDWAVVRAAIPTDGPLTDAFGLPVDLTRTESDAYRGPDPVVLAATAG